MSESSQYGRKPKTSRRRPLGPMGAAAPIPSPSTTLSPDQPEAEAEAGATVASSGAIGRSIVSSSPVPADLSSAWPGASPLRPGAFVAQIEPCGASRISRPVAWPGGSARGALPSISQRSPARGLNGTVTRSPGSNAMVSSACSWACSQWTDSRSSVMAPVPSAAPPAPFPPPPFPPARGASAPSVSRLAGRAETGAAVAAVAATSSARPIATRCRACVGGVVASVSRDRARYRRQAWTASPTNVPLRGGTEGSSAVRCGSIRPAQGPVPRSLLDQLERVDGRERPIPRPDHEAIAQGASEAQGWSESGRVPPSVGSHGTSVSMGPLMPPS